MVKGTRLWTQPVHSGCRNPIRSAASSLPPSSDREPDDAQAHKHLGLAFGQKGQTGEAIQQFQEALKIRPDYADARRNLEVVLATQATPSPPPGASTNR